MTSIKVGMFNLSVVMFGIRLKFYSKTAMCGNSQIQSPGWVNNKDIRGMLLGLDRFPPNEIAAHRRGMSGERFRPQTALHSFKLLQSIHNQLGGFLHQKYRTSPQAKPSLLFTSIDYSSDTSQRSLINSQLLSSLSSSSPQVKRRVGLTRSGRIGLTIHYFQSIASIALLRF